MTALEHNFWIAKSRVHRLFGRTPIGRVIRVMRSRGFAPEKMSVLELFGGTGGIHLHDYVSGVKSAVAWEIDPQALEILQKRFPSIECRQADTYASIHTETRTFDWIISDNPMRQHGEHFEHFDLFPGLLKRANNPAVLIFSIIPHADEFYLRQYPGLFSEEHLRRRKDFYGVANPERLSASDFAAAFGRHIDKDGWKMDWWHVEPRNPLLSYFVCGVRKTS